MLFPFLLDEAASECKFRKKTHTLTLSLSVTAKKPLPADDVLPVDDAPATAAVGSNGAAGAAASSSATPPRPMVDWQAKLGLQNTMMFQLVSTE